MGFITKKLEVGLRVEVEDRLLVIDPDVALKHGGVGDDGADRHLVLGVDVVVGRGEHHEPGCQLGVLCHLGAEEAIAEHVQWDSSGHVVATSGDEEVEELTVGAEYEVGMAWWAVQILVARVECLQYELAVRGVRAKLLPDPLELVEWLGAEVLPLHRLLGAYAGPGAPGAAIGSGQASLGVGKEVPEVFRWAKITDPIVPIDIPHKLPEEITYGHLTERQSRKPVPQIDLNRLAEGLLVAEIITPHNLSTLTENLAGDLDVLKVEGKAGLRHRLSC